MTQGDDKAGRPAIAPLIRLAAVLLSEGRGDDAHMLLDECSALAPGRLDFREALVELAVKRGRVVEGLEALLRLIEAGAPRAYAVERFTPLLNQAFADVQIRYDRGEAEEAVLYLDPLTEILPDHANLQGMALSCSRFLKTTERSKQLMRRLLALDPSHGEARMTMIEHLHSVGDLAAEAEWRHALMLADPQPIPKLNHIWNAYELINLTICDPLTEMSMARIEQAKQALDRIDYDPAATSGPDAWARFCRAMAGGIDFSALHRPPTQARPPAALAGSDGTPMTVAELRDLAARHRAEAVFLVAADEAYAADYARFYVRSVLRNAGVRALTIVHIVGGGTKLAEIARRIGITDERLVLSGDDFDPAMIASQVVDAPSQPRITKPAAHYQSARFHQAPWILSELGLPLIVTDVDCLLERDVRDLLALAPTTDFVLNENIVMRQLGARITANLLLLFPTPDALEFVRFVSSYLEAMLQRPDIPKFIDQIALLIGRHYMAANRPGARIGYFDVETDINNCIFMEYYAHPFRFLSLYRGFDMASLPEWHRGD
jgi:tetratricopeptide (TPR) repeat protein